MGKGWKAWLEAGNSGRKNSRAKPDDVLIVVAGQGEGSRRRQNGRGPGCWLAGTGAEEVAITKGICSSLGRRGQMARRRHEMSRPVLGKRLPVGVWTGGRWGLWEGPGGAERGRRGASGGRHWVTSPGRPKMRSRGP